MMLSLKDAARQVLHDADKPLHYKEITRRILDSGLSQSGSKTPSTTLNAILAADIKRYGAGSSFLRVTPGVFSLRTHHGADPGTATVEEATDGKDRRVRIPHFPLYEEVRLVLPVWAGMQRTEVTGLQSTLAMQRGTPQEPVDWSLPDEWILNRLAGSDRDTALAIWNGTDKRVNPRHVYGHWLLATNYGLLKANDGALLVTERGDDFLRSPGGETETALDKLEGLTRILALVADSGPAAFSNLLPGWGEYLSRRSKFGTDSTIKDTLRRRLRNLLDRGLLNRSSIRYTISEAGLAYLGRTGDEDEPNSVEHQEIRKLIRQQQSVIRESIHAILADLDPFAFEHLAGLFHASCKVLRWMRVTPGSGFFGAYRL